MTASSPAKKGLHNIYESSKRLEKKDADTLQSIVAKLLWVEKGGSPNIETAILFLCSIVTKSTNENKAKLRRVLKYLKHTIDDRRIVREDSVIQLCTWIDAKYVVHPNQKIHTSGCMSFGYGMVNFNHSKQKLNTKSST